MKPVGRKCADCRWLKPWNDSYGLTQYWCAKKRKNLGKDISRRSACKDFKKAA